VQVENDANTAALAEALKGGGKNIELFSLLHWAAEWVAG